MIMGPEIKHSRQARCLMIMLMEREIKRSIRLYLAKVQWYWVLLHQHLGLTHMYLICQFLATMGLQSGEKGPYFPPEWCLVSLCMVAFHIHPVIPVQTCICLRQGAVFRHPECRVKIKVLKLLQHGTMLVKVVKILNQDMAYSFDGQGFL